MKNLTQGHPSHQMTTAQDYPSWYSMTAGSAGLSIMALLDHDLVQEGWTGRSAFMPSLRTTASGIIAGQTILAMMRNRVLLILPRWANPGSVSASHKKPSVIC